jgi:hypothetical protein
MVNTAEKVRLRTASAEFNNGNLPLYTLKSERSSGGSLLNVVGCEQEIQGASLSNGNGIDQVNRIEGFHNRRHRGSGRRNI